MNTDVDNRIPDTQDISDTLTGPTDKQEQIIETQDTLILTGIYRLSIIVVSFLFSSERTTKEFLAQMHFTVKCCW